MLPLYKLLWIITTEIKKQKETPLLEIGIVLSNFQGVFCLWDGNTEVKI